MSTNTTIIDAMNAYTDAKAATVVVRFRKEKSGDFKGIITAVFPNEKWNDNGDLTCYAHVGQHSACSKEWVRNKTVPATVHEYADLKLELEAIGYILEIKP